jgi:hypothetical protein
VILAETPDAIVTVDEAGAIVIWRKVEHEECPSCKRAAMVLKRVGNQTRCLECDK